MLCIPHLCCLSIPSFHHFFAITSCLLTKYVSKSPFIDSYLAKKQIGKCIYNHFFSCWILLDLFGQLPYEMNPFPACCQISRWHPSFSHHPKSSMSWLKCYCIPSYTWYPHDIHMEVSINGATPKWMVYKGKCHENGWFRGTPILGNSHVFYSNPYMNEIVMGLPWLKARKASQPRSHGNELSMRELERQLQELRRDKAMIAASAARIGSWWMMNDEATK